MIPAPRLAGAPITWGVCEVPGWGRQLDRSRVLAEIADAGLAATELGPRGFLPEDPAELAACLAAHGLGLVGGFVPAVLHRPETLDEELEAVAERARTVAGAGGEVLVLAAATGRDGYEAPLAPAGPEWETLRRALDRAQAIGRRHGVIVALHPHYGTAIAGTEEVRRLIDTTDVPLCLDTGHLMVAGADPVEIARRADGRIAHVHLKDVRASLAERVRSGEIGYREAVRRGMYRTLGDGDADLASLLGVLRDGRYDGWYVLEQDAVVESNDDGGPLERARKSVGFLKQVMSG